MTRPVRSVKKKLPKGWMEAEPHEGMLTVYKLQMSGVWCVEVAVAFDGRLRCRRGTRATADQARRLGVRWLRASLKWKAKR